MPQLLKGCCLVFLSTAGHRAARMVAITGLNPDISKQMITEQVADAVEVMIPKSYTSDEPEQIKG